MPAQTVFDVATEVGLWRERALTAEGRLDEAVDRLAGAEARILELAEQVAVLSRMLFGRSSEKASAGGVGDPAGGDGLADPAGPPGFSGPGDDEVAGRGQRRGSKGHGRRDYSRLQTREEIHDVADGQRVCSGCGQQFEFLGSECSEQIDWQVSITRIVHRRRRYRRRCQCPGPRTVIAPPAPNPVGKGRFTHTFLARLLYQKYVLGLPVHRIVKALAAEGLDVAEGTMSGVLKAAGDLLAPLEEAIGARNAQAVHVHADETSWRVFEQVEGKDGHRWWLWVFIADDTVVFRMDPTRNTTVLERHFGIKRTDGALTEGRRLLLSTDFYTAYQSLARIDGVDPLWCWAHIRRYFIRAGDAHQQLQYWANAWVARISDLYLAHQAMAAAQPATAQHTLAQAGFDQALTAIDTARHQQAAGPGLHPAARKVLATLDREWDGLIRHRDFPDPDLDNNKSERALRTPVVGRKNYYGSHAQWSAHLAARVWTITATAQRHHQEPLTYLNDYLNACAEAGGKPPQGQALQRFLPWTLDPTDPTHSRDHDPPKITQPG
ncbi:MAG: IS66 family transposase [Pseudonocardiaceae bacterium]